MASRNRRGKISFSWEDEEEATNDSEIQIPSRKPSSNTSNSTISKPSVPFDVSQIKDRVLQMDLGEEIILTGDAIEALEEDEENEDFALSEQIRKAKEARKRVQLQDEPEEVIYLDEPATGSEFWSKRDAQEADQVFSSHAHSRVIREDLVNDRDDTDAIEGFTPTGPLSRRLLERDLKSAEFYNTELNFDEGEDEEEAQWHTAQIRKGMEKGWRSGANDDEVASFVGRQAKLLSTFAPPKAPETITIDALLAEESVQLASLNDQLNALQVNISRLQSGVEGFDGSRFDSSALEVEATGIRSCMSKVSKWHAFLTTREPELAALEACYSSTDSLARDAWEHFFDDVDDQELLDLRGVWVAFGGELEVLEQIVGFFCRYHLIRLRDEGAQRDAILEESGLEAIFSLLRERYSLQIDEESNALKLSNI